MKVRTNIPEKIEITLELDEKEISNLKIGANKLGLTLEGALIIAFYETFMSSRDFNKIKGGLSL